MGNSNSSSNDPGLILSEVNKIKRKFSKNKWENIYKLIAEDANRRNNKSERILYNLKDVLKEKTDPNIYNKKYTIIDQTETFNIKIKSNKEFKNKLFKQFPILTKLDFSNIALAGGAVSCILGDQQVNDLDIFFHGLNKNQAQTKTLEIINHVTNYCKENKMEYCVIKSNKIIKIYYNIRFIKHRCYYEEIQLIPRLYNTLAEMLYGFDLGSSAVAFDGNKVYFSSVGKYAYVNKMNIIDTLKRSYTYEKRLLKYYTRGFGLILPFSSKFNKALNKFDDPRISLGKLRVDYNKRNNKYQLNKWSYYSGMNKDYDDINIKKYTAYHVFNNIISLINYEGVNFIISDDIKKELENKVKFYQECSVEKYKIKKTKKVHNPKTNTYQDVQEVKINFKKKSVYELLNTFNPDICSRIIKNISYANEHYQEFIDEQIKYLMNRINEYQTVNLTDLVDLEWIEIDPTSQACGSYNPILENPRELYKLELYIRYGRIEIVNIFNPVLYKYYEELLLNEKYDDKSKVVTFYGYSQLE